MSGAAQLLWQPYLVTTVRAQTKWKALSNLSWKASLVASFSCTWQQLPTRTNLSTTPPQKRRRHAVNFHRSTPL